MKTNLCLDENYFDDLKGLDVRTAEDLKKMQCNDAYITVEFEKCNKWHKEEFENILLDLPDNYNLSRMDEDYIRMMSTKSRKQRIKLAGEFLEKYAPKRK